MEDKRLTDEEIDTIGEIMNISMGAAATAVSTMLERQVVITTPSIEQNKLKNIDCSELEPAIVVKINYVQGLTGANLIVLRRNDMRIILDLLMGNDLSDADESFEFDDMSMSAASEVMNQMMGASATALSELLGETINISTPQATLIDSDIEVYELLEDYTDEDDDVMAISFKMTIKETLDTTFTSIMPLELTRKIVSSLHNEIEEAPQPDPQPTPQPVVQPAPQPAPQPTPQPIPPQPPAPQQPVPQSAPQPIPQQPAPQPVPMQYQQMPNSQQAGAAPYQPPYPQPMQEQYPYNAPNPQQAASMPPYQPPYPQPYQQQYTPPQAPYGNEYYAQYNPYPEQHANLRYAAPMVNVKQADFPEFGGGGKANLSPYSSNINMLMGVQLEVSVIVGRAKQRIKDVLDFGQGSVIELDKQTGAPAEIVVNGQLLAYGDVVVVGDNFGVRITEIVGTKELLDSLDAKK